MSQNYKYTKGERDMRNFFLTVLLGTLLLSACGTNEGIASRDAWARPATLGENSAIYLLLQNHTAEDDELVSASTDAAEIVELHESRMVDGSDMMEMVPQDSIPVPAKGEVELKPGGLHIMLVNLKQDLKVGDKIEVTLRFKSGLEMKLTVPVMEGMDSMDGM
jgi:copper(I)-binding protein